MATFEASFQLHLRSDRQRRRSADVGGLHLATGNNGHGQGWMASSGELHTRYAELLGDMYTQTIYTISEHSSDLVPTDIPNETRSRLIHSLDRWHFEPHKLPEEEVVACTLILFETLFRIDGMRDAVKVPMRQIASFVNHLRRIYRLENSYHTFEHALDVLQATHSYLRAAGMVPSPTILLEPARIWRSTEIFDSGPLITCLGQRDLFALYIAAIGHDVGHPGFTNVFMKNAQTPLSLVFDGQSALEQMHCQLLLSVMRHHGMGSLLDGNEGLAFRKLLWSTVMVTDMRVHDDFMRRLKKECTGPDRGPLAQRKVLVCQGLLKCADISNPSRPFAVSEYWAAALGEEWSSQALFEQFLDLEPTVEPSKDPLIKAKSQVFFITTFAKPLLALMTAAVPEMAFFARQCDANLARWTIKKGRLESQYRKDPPAAQATITAPPISPMDEYSSAFPLTLPQAFNSELETWFTPDSSMSSGSAPCSPCDSLFSSVYYPLSESLTLNNGAASSSSSFARRAHDAHAEIRAAGRLGVRRHLKMMMKRNSWCGTTTLATRVEDGVVSEKTRETGLAVPFRVDPSPPPPPASAPATVTTVAIETPLLQRRPPPICTMERNGNGNGMGPLCGNLTMMGEKSKGATAVSL